MMQQSGGMGGGAPKIPRGTLGLGGLIIFGGAAVFAINASIFNGLLLITFTFLTGVVEGGHRAIKYKRVSGISRYIYGEGTHFNIPWFETPIIYDVRAKPRNIASLTGTKGIQSSTGSFNARV
jgi:prohibitin 2